MAELVRQRNSLNIALENLNERGDELSETTMNLQQAKMRVGLENSKTFTQKMQRTNKEIKHVRILGPVRARSQIELAFTDCQTLGLSVPTRISGDNLNSFPIVLIPEDVATGKPARKELSLDSGVIRAWRIMDIQK